MVPKSCAMAACLSCLDGLGLMFRRGSDAEPKVESTAVNTADTQRVGMHSASMDAQPPTRQSDGDSFAANMDPVSVESISIEPGSIESSSMEPMKVHVRAKSEDFSLGHLQVRGAMSPLSSNRAMSMQDAWPAFPVAAEMLADPSFSWAPLQAMAQLNQGSMMHGSGTCSPCAWYWKPKTCLNGMDCPFCHLCPDGELKSRRKTKLAVMRSAGFPPRSRSQQFGQGEETPQKSKSCHFGGGEESPQKTAHVLSLSSLL